LDRCCTRFTRCHRRPWLRAGCSRAIVPPTISALDGATFVQTLVFTYLADPEATLDQVTQTAAALNVDIASAGLT